MDKIYSVIVMHEAVVHNNYLFTDKDKALAKVEEIKQEWVCKNEVGNTPLKELAPFGVYYFEPRLKCYERLFGTQYAGALGYWYENGEYEHGSVTLMECTLD